jgi:hypothetical protein
VLAIVTSAVPKATLFAIFSGLAKGLSAQKLAPFIGNMHTALWVLTATSLLGAVVCMLRPAHVASVRPAPDPVASPIATASDPVVATAADPLVTS